MGVAVTDNEKVDFLSLLPPQWEAVVTGWHWPKFRAKQVADWVYNKSVTDPALFSNLKPQDRDFLRDHVNFAASTRLAHQISEDGTHKMLLGWEGAQQAETVMIPAGDRRTACVSSQVGCPVGCKFCASGMEGVKGNLTPGQIVEQVVRLNQAMIETPPTSGGIEFDDAEHFMPSRAAQYPAPKRGGPGNRITNIVFMGMGEPMANYANVMQAIRILHDPMTFNISARKITVSTVGVPKRIRDLANEELPLNLALSLHAPNEALRQQLIPWAEHFSMGEILDACRYYFDRTGREITFEYILLSDVNDRPEHAKQLVQICRTIRANVNLLRYNEVESLPYQRPKAEAVVRFQEILRAGGVNAHVRKSRGRDIAAACGQLRRRENERQKDALVQLGA